MSTLQPQPGKYQCPACQREIYSRKRKTCEFCGAAVPEEIRLSEEEVEVMEKEIEEIHTEHEHAVEEEDRQRHEDVRNI